MLGYRDRMSFLLHYNLLGRWVGLIATVCVVAPLAMAKPCDLIYEMARSGGRYVKMELPKGRQLYFLFAPHLDPSLQSELQKHLNRDQPLTGNGQVFTTLAREVLKSQKIILESKKIELKTIEELTKIKTLHWLGVELPESDLVEFRGQVVPQRLALNKRLMAAGLTATESRDLALLLYDSVQFWLSESPDRPAKFQWIGVEDEKRHFEALKSAEKIEDLKSALKEYDRQVAKISPESLQNLQDEIGVILGQKRMLARASDKKIISRFPSSESQEMAAEQMTAARNLVASSLRRDRAVATNLTQKLQGNGLVTMGRAHEESLLQKSVELCKELIP